MGRVKSHHWLITHTSSKVLISDVARNFLPCPDKQQRRDLTPLPKPSHKPSYETKISFLPPSIGLMYASRVFA